MKFSVVIPVYLSNNTVERCIHGLQAQSFKDFEVIFVDSSPDERSAEIIRQYPQMHLLRSETRLWMFAARNLGVKKAKGEILVFTDPDCIPRADWLQQIHLLFERGYRAVGGSIDCLPGAPKERLSHLVKFWRWLPSEPSGLYDDVPTANFAIDKKLFYEMGGFQEQYISADTLIGYQLRDRGWNLYFDSKATVEHIHEGTTYWSLIRERAKRGKAFGEMRRSLKSWNRWKSFIFLAGIWYLPLRHLYWKMKACWRWRSYGLLVWGIPLILVCEIAWMLGQGRVYLKDVIGAEEN